MNPTLLKIKNPLKLTALTYFLVFLVISGAKAQEVTSLTLVNANTDLDIAELTEGYEIDLNTTGSGLNVRANTTATASVKFFLDGAEFRIESAAPFALAGDNSGDYFVWSPSLGDHTLKVVPYSEAGAGGTAGTAVEISFSVTETTVDIEIPVDIGTGEVAITGELKKWHKITLSFDGPAYNELAKDPNPFWTSAWKLLLQMVRTATKCRVTLLPMVMLGNPVLIPAIFGGYTLLQIKPVHGNILHHLE